MLVAEKLNARRLQLLDELQASCSMLEDTFKAQILAWVVGQRKWALEHLQAPQDDDTQVLLDAVRKQGALRVLQDVYVFILDLTFAVSHTIQDRSADQEDRRYLLSDQVRHAPAHREGQARHPRRRQDHPRAHSQRSRGDSDLKGRFLCTGTGLLELVLLKANTATGAGGGEHVHRSLPEHRQRVFA